jgi:hypothetical protein
MGRASQRRPWNALRNNRSDHQQRLRASRKRVRPAAMPGTAGTAAVLFEQALERPAASPARASGAKAIAARSGAADALDGQTAFPRPAGRPAGRADGVGPGRAGDAGLDGYREPGSAEATGRLAPVCRNDIGEPDINIMRAPMNDRMFEADMERPAAPPTTSRPTALCL